MQPSEPEFERKTRKNFLAPKGGVRKISHGRMEKKVRSRAASVTIL